MKFNSYPSITQISGPDTLLVFQKSSSAVKQITASDFSAIVGSPQGAINVKWFGARGDGTTDDTAAIQAAVDSAHQNQSVFFPNSTGAYIVKSPIQITGKQNLMIFGFGSLISGSNENEFQFFEVSGGENVSFSGLSFNGARNSLDSANGSILITNGTSVSIGDCKFINTAGAGVLIVGGTRISVYGCIFTNTFYGIKTDSYSSIQASLLIVSENSFSCRDTGIYLRDSSSCSVASNTISLPATFGSGIGISIIRASTKISVTGNSISGSGNGGITVDGLLGSVNDVLITGNSIKSDRSNIYISDSYAISVVGNVLASAGIGGNTIGIHVNAIDSGIAANVEALMIRDNTFKGTYAGGIIYLLQTNNTCILNGIDISGNNTQFAVSGPSAISYTGISSFLRNVKCSNNRGDGLVISASNNLDFPIFSTSSDETIIVPNVDTYAVNAFGGRSITLPSAANFPGLQVTVIKVDAGADACTVVGTINGVVNYVMTVQYKYVTVKSNGASWYIVNKN